VTRRWNDRLALLNWRSALLSLVLVGMVVVSAIGAWQVRVSWLDHQRAVERTLDEYASYAARSFFQAQLTESLILRQRAMAAALAGPAYDGALLTLDRFARYVNDAIGDRSALATDPLGGHFRIQIASGRFEGRGRATDPQVMNVVRQLAGQARPALDTSSVPMRMQADVDGERASFYFAMQRDAAGRPLAIYGFMLSWRRAFAEMIGSVLPRTLLLPPSVLDPAGGAAPIERVDTMVALRIVEADGRVYYQSPGQFTSTATGTYRPSDRAELVVHAALHPSLVARLRSELLDDDRRRMQLALPIFSVLFAIAAILHIWRERELVRARRDFVASVSHELRTPLAQIRMFSETLLLRREESEEERMKWIGVIARETRRLGDLVENILLFSHIDAARVRLEPERTDLGELVEEVVEAYVPIAACRQVRIVADAPSRIFAVVDPRAMRQVVVNLLDNALKYGPNGQTVTVEVERDNSTARLSVSDQGPGIPAKDRARLWRPFVRLRNDGSTAGGSGIGLSVVRSLVEQHGGSVSVEDASDSGARFVVTLPTSQVNG